MKMENEGTQKNLPMENGAETSKLMSLLALAAGALAMPQTSYGDIVFTDLSSHPVTVGPLADPSYLLTLPGTHQFAFRTVAQGSTATGSVINFVLAGQLGGGIGVYVNLKTTGNSLVLPVGKSVFFSQINQPGIYRSGVVGSSHTLNGAHSPNAYDHQYLAFQFKDSTQGNKLLNGWIELSEHFPASGGGPEVTIFGYAIDNSGNPLATGVVPEPSSGSLLAFGAMTLGAAGVRAWRRKKAK